MTLIPFLGGADGNPTELHEAIIEQATEGIPPALSDTWRDISSYGGGPTLTQETVEALAFSPTGEPTQNLDGKLLFSAGDKVIGDLDPADYGLLYFLANLFKQYDKSTPSAGIEQWQFQRSGATDGPDWLANRVYNNVWPAHVIFDMLCGGVTISAGPGDNLRAAFNLAAGRLLMAGEAVAETATGSPTAPKVRGIWPAQMREDDLDVWIKTVIDNGDGTVDVQISLNAAATEPTWSTTQTLTLGEWLRAWDSEDAGWIGGSIGAAIEVYLPAAATLEDGAVFRVPKHSADWTNTLGTSRAIASVDTLAILDGQEIRVTDGLEIGAAWETVEVQPGVFGRQGHRVKRTGKFIPTITPSREIEDLTLQEAVLNQREVSFVIHAETGVMIPGQSEPFQFYILLPAMKGTGNLYTPEEGSDTASEAPAFTGFPPATTFTYTDPRGTAFTTDDAIAMIARNDVSAL